METVEVNHIVNKVQESKKQQILTWTIGNQIFGMHIDRCREVVKDRQITKVPFAKESVEGIVNLRGEVVTVLDLSTLLGYKREQSGHDAYVIIRLKSDTKHVSIKADSISDVLEIDEAKIEPTPAHLNEMETRYILAVAMTERGLVIILNADEILRAS
jgi:purine-binding chemotaxis protein CheW